MSLDGDFYYYYHGDTLLERRKIELVDAKLMLARYTYAKNSKQKSDAWNMCEYWRWKARIESIELAIQTLQRINQ